MSSRRRKLRAAGPSIRDFAESLAPAGTLASVQTVWRDVAGPVIAEQATPTGEAYWLPVDAEGPQSTNVLRTRLWIASSTLREALATAPNRHTLVVSDSCYSGNFLRLRGAPSVAAAAVSASEYLTALSALHQHHRSRSVISSGGNAPVIDVADDSGLSIFARAFVDYLKNNVQVVSSNELHLAIKPRVVVAASRLRFEQEPQWGQLPLSGHEAGDFYFVPR